jgi:hypothetical protein
MDQHVAVVDRSPERRRRSGYPVRTLTDGVPQLVIANDIRRPPADHFAS